MQAQVLAVEGEGAVEVAAGDANNDAKPVDNQGTTSPGMYNPKCLLEVWASGTLCEGFVLLKTPSRPKLWVGCITRWKRETPIGRSLLNEFFNKLMRSERKQEIAKAKLKKARQQLNVQANPQQVAGQGGVLQ